MGNRAKHTDILVGGYRLTAKTRDINPISIAYDELDDGGYGQDHSTMKGKGDSTIGLTGYYDGDTTGGFHNGVKTLADAEVLVSLLMGENAAPALGDITLSLSAEEVSYHVNPMPSDVIAATGSFRGRTIVAEFGNLLADTTATSDSNGSSLDNGAGTSNGGTGICHITGVSASDTIQVTVQHSTDNSSWSDLVVFTIDGSAVAAERIEVTGTVNRYLRAEWDVTGSGVSMQIVVIFARK